MICALLLARIRLIKITITHPNFKNKTLVRFIVKYTHFQTQETGSRGEKIQRKLMLFTFMHPGARTHKNTKLKSIHYCCGDAACMKRGGGYEAACLPPPPQKKIHPFGWRRALRSSYSTFWAVTRGREEEEEEGDENQRTHVSQFGKYILCVQVYFRLFQLCSCVDSKKVILHCVSPTNYCVKNVTAPRQKHQGLSHPVLALLFFEFSLTFD